ncbi:hypothetical protein WBG99_14085 [Streptomyces sp. TG1A-60]|uniref:hypothetical protein n=1 Tax=Streptomyces sp. TG1A-60 TaxID=3129111 RepID=UPI0030D14C2A
MGEISRRGMLGLGVGAATTLGLAGCGTGLGSGPGEGGASGDGGKNPGKGKGKPENPVKPLGDGSTADTGRQPNQPDKPRPLAAGEKPPQFVVFSWDGAGDVGNGLFERFLKAGRDHGAHMTFFLSGIYVLPESKKRKYLPPNNAPGASDIGYLTDEHIKSTLGHLRTAWLDGHEIGTHFNGHFCGDGFGSVGRWTPKQWRSEIDQAKAFVKEWRTNSGWTDVEPLPFDYEMELIGGRTPCLLGQENLLPTARELGWRYDSSSPGGLQVWPRRKQGVWDLPLQSIPFPGRGFEVLSMDYNIMYNQSQNSTQAPPANHPAYRTQATGAYVAGFQRAYETNRAPLFIGNHFEEWNGGVYMDAVEESLKHIARAREKATDGDIRIVSFRQFVDWMDVQPPEVLAQLQALGVGQRPPAGWKEFLKVGSAV